MSCVPRPGASVAVCAPARPSQDLPHLFLMIRWTMRSVVRSLPLSIWQKMPLLLGSWRPEGRGGGGPPQDPELPGPGESSPQEDQDTGTVTPAA